MKSKKIAAIATALIMSATTFAGVIPTFATTTFNGISTESSLTDVMPGSAIQFIADITSDESTAISWQVSGNNSLDTYIDDNGVLHVADDETSPEFFVLAVSVADPTQLWTQFLYLYQEDEGCVTGIAISKWDRCFIGGTSQFAGVVYGTGDYSDIILWSVAGNEDIDTYITANGVLHIGELETSKQVTVTARSAENQLYMASVKVDIEEPGAPEIPVHQHTVVTDSAVAATCAKTGLTAGSHCSVCGEVIVAQQIIPVKSHTEVTDPAVAATCAKTGLTEGSHCSECGEVIVAQQVTGKTVHSFQSKKILIAPTYFKVGRQLVYCSGCGEGYEEEVPKLKLNLPDGLVYVSAEGGGWYLVQNKEVATDVTTVAHNENGWFYVIHGKVNFSYTGLGENENGIWYIKNGKVDFDYNGFFVDEDGAWYIEGGQVKTGKSEVIHGTIKGKDGWWNVVNGKVKFAEDVASNGSGWWYIGADGKVDFNYNGLASNANGTWYIKNGQVDFNYKGFVSDRGGVWYLEGGQVKTNKNEVVYGTVNGKNGWWNVVNGKVKFAEDVASNCSGWWYIGADGMVDFNFKGLADNAYGIWYCEGGQVKFGQSDVLYCSYKNENAWWNIQGGELKKGETVAQNSAGWWYIDKSGKVDFNFTGLASNANGTWYCKDGKVDFGFTGTFDGKQINGGKVVG